MKKSLLAFALLGLSATATYAQGTIQFLNSALSRLQYQEVPGGPITTAVPFGPTSLPIEGRTLPARRQSSARVAGRWLVQPRSPQEGAYGLPRDLPVALAIQLPAPRKANVFG